MGNGRNGGLEEMGAGRNGDWKKWGLEEMETGRSEDWKKWLWRQIIELQGQTFRTSGRGGQLGVEFVYSISSTGSNRGRRYSGPEIEGYGNELWIIRDGERKRKSVSRSTVELAYIRYLEIMDDIGVVRGPKALGIPGSGSYLYPVIKRIVEDAKDGSSSN
jgi:hypothetical protein